MLCKDLKEESKMSLASLEEEGREIRFKGSRKKHGPFIGGAGGVDMDGELRTRVGSSRSAEAVCLVPSLGQKQAPPL